MLRELCDLKGEDEETKSLYFTNNGKKREIVVILCRAKGGDTSPLL